MVPVPCRTLNVQEQGPAGGTTTFTEPVECSAASEVLFCSRRYHGNCFEGYIAVRTDDFVTCRQPFLNTSGPVLVVVGQASASASFWLPAAPIAFPDSTAVTSFSEHYRFSRSLYSICSAPFAPIPPSSKPAPQTLRLSIT